MNKSITLITFFIFILFSNIVPAQDELKIAEDKDSSKDTRVYHIKSLEGKDQQIHVVPDYYHHVLKISCLNDTITDQEFWGVPVEVHILRGQFAEIKYDVRGGSNLGLGTMLILCVSKGKMYEAMHVLRYADSETGDEKKNYNMKATLNRDSKRNYWVTVDIHDMVHSKSKPETNYTYNNQTILHFDISKHVFYNVKEDVSDSFVVTDNPKTGKSVKQKISGNFPIIILGKDKYYFIKDRWYEPGDNKEFY